MLYLSWQQQNHIKFHPLLFLRAQRFDFKAISSDQIIDRLKYVANSQSLDYDDAALEFIAKASEGGMRDALSIMDQAIAFGDERLTLQDALNVTGSVDEAALNELFNDIVKVMLKPHLIDIIILFQKVKKSTDSLMI